jgi:hypothetical protein
VCCCEGDVCVSVLLFIIISSSIMLCNAFVALLIIFMQHNTGDFIIIITCGQPGGLEPPRPLLPHTVFNLLITTW